MINKAEYNFLKSIEDGRWYRDIEIGSNLDFVRRTGYFLSTKGLVEMQEHIFKRKILNEKGNKIAEEFKRLETGIGMDKIPSYMLGVLKALGMIKDGVFIKRDVDLESYLMEHGYGKEINDKYYSFRITPSGLEAIKSWNEKSYTITIEALKNNNIEIPFVDTPNIQPAYRAKHHIITRWKNKITKIFYELGFREMDGGYIQPSFWNFDMLFQPQDHPSRELADTFYLDRKAKTDIDTKEVAKEHQKYWHYDWNIDEASKLVLRTHTTVLSAITLHKYGAGRYFSIGKVFRNEATDYKHLAEFHQIEGIIADRSVRFDHLLGFLEEFYSRLGLDKIRFRPSYFPYTEPSLEIEAYLPSKDDWIEVGGAGIFREQVSRMLGAVYPVAAFGLSLERLIMLFEEIDDIRSMYD